MYVGCKVFIEQKSLKCLTGTLSKVETDRIELVDVEIPNGDKSYPFQTIRSNMIKNIRILSMPPEQEQTANNSSSMIADDGFAEPTESKRHQRREQMRNMPNARNVYVCPDSPPRIAAAPQNRQPTQDVLTSGVTNSPDKRRKPIVVKGRNQYTSDYKTSDAAYASDNEDESDSAPGRFHSNRRLNRKHNHLSQSGGSTRTRMRSIDWDHVKVEEFLDHDFDFEKNLALFNKTAFYEMVDAQSDANSATAASGGTNNRSGNAARSHNIDTSSSNNTTKSKSDNKDGGTRLLREDCTMFTNTATMSLSGQHGRFGSSSQQKDDDILRFSSSPRSTSLVADSPAPPVNDHRLSGEHHHRREWASATNGLNVSVISPCDRADKFRRLVSGDGIRQGFSWPRLIDSASRSLVDRISTHLVKCSSSVTTPIGSANKKSLTSPQQRRTPPPHRILIIPPSTPKQPSSLLCITLARLLACRGACVCLWSPPTDKDPVLASEMELTRGWAPSISLDHVDYDEDEDSSDSSSEDVDSSKLGRMWVGRLPGLKTFKNPSSINLLVDNVRVDAVIIGHSDDDTAPPPLLPDPIDAWLGKHQAISFAVHLLPRPDFCQQTPTPSATHTWTVDLGLPCMQPPNSISQSIQGHSHFLVDIGMTRHFRINYLPLLPSHRLFECESIVELLPTDSSVSQKSRRRFVD